MNKSVGGRVVNPVRSMWLNCVRTVWWAVNYKFMTLVHYDFGIAKVSSSFSTTVRRAGSEHPTPSPLPHTAGFGFGLGFVHHGWPLQQRHRQQDQRVTHLTRFAADMLHNLSSALRCTRDCVLCRQQERLLT
jgi:hypothetical protein